MEKQKTVKEITRGNILDAFWDLYSKMPIYKVTVKDICKNAGYNRSTFYEYFTDPYDCLDQIESSVLPSEISVPFPSNIEVPIEMPIKVMAAFFEKNEKYLKILLSPNGDPNFQYKLKKTIKPLMKQIIGKRMNASEEEADYICEFNISGMLGLLTHYICSKRSICSEKLVSLAFRLNTKGINGFMN